MVRGVDSIDTVAVVGGGTMGSGIAQVAAMHGYDVVLRDVEDELIADAFDRIENSLDRFLDGETITGEEREAALSRITGTTEFDDVGPADFVVEAVVEKADVKGEVLAAAAAVVDDGVVLATNTSTLSVTELGAATDRPSLVVGLHFMNPAQLMPGVEVVVGERTGEETVDVAEAFAASLDKETWRADDRPGFVVNRILLPWINEAVRARDEGVATAEEIDRAMELGTNVPAGPFELADTIGLDICLASMETLHEELGDRYTPAYLLKRKVAAGDLGKKSGRGFYRYE